jgi:hypothetical protein
LSFPTRAKARKSNRHQAYYLNARGDGGIDVKEGLKRLEIKEFRDFKSLRTERRTIIFEIKK